MQYECALLKLHIHMENVYSLMLYIAVKGLIAFATRVCESHLRGHCTFYMLHVICYLLHGTCEQSITCLHVTLEVHITAIARIPILTWTQLLSCKLRHMFTGYTCTVHVIAIAIRVCGIAFAEPLTPETVCMKRGVTRCLHVPFHPKPNQTSQPTVHKVPEPSKLFQGRCEMTIGGPIPRVVTSHMP